jgi:hypothetical protein
VVVPVAAGGTIRSLAMVWSAHCESMLALQACLGDAGALSPISGQIDININVLKISNNSMKILYHYRGALASAVLNMMGRRPIDDGKPTLSTLLMGPMSIG